MKPTDIQQLVDFTSNVAHQMAEHRKMHLEPEAESHLRILIEDSLNGDPEYWRRQVDIDPTTYDNLEAVEVQINVALEVIFDVLSRKMVTAITKEAIEPVINREGDKVFPFSGGAGS